MKQAIAFLTLLLVPVCVFAVDGQVLINQATVMAAGGFPYVISNPGSYKLSGNLAAPAGVDAIHIAASNVVLDLNGFSIASLGPSSSFFEPIGIQATGAIRNLSIHNGSMTGWPIAVETATFGANLVTIADINFEENFTSVSNADAISAAGNVLIKRVVTDGQIHVICPAVVVDTIANFLERAGDVTRCTLANDSIGLVQ
jgi:hypothetical protein